MKTLNSVFGFILLFQITMSAQKLPVVMPFNRSADNPEKPWSALNTSTQKESRLDCAYLWPERGGKILFTQWDAEYKPLYGVMDTNLKVIIPARFPFLSAFDKGMAAAQESREGLYGYVDESGKWIIPPKFLFADGFHGDYATVYNEESIGIIDRKGELVVPYSFEEFRWPAQGSNLAKAKTMRGWGMIDCKTLKEVLPFKFWDFGDAFHSGMMRAKMKMYWGFIDSTGKEIVACQYEDAGEFYDGLAPVMRNGKWGYINVQGQEVIPFDFVEAGEFGNGRACVRKDKKGKALWIDTRGTVIREFEKDQCVALGRCAGKYLAFARETDKGAWLWGYMDMEGKVVIRPELEDAETPMGNVAFASKYDSLHQEKRWGMIGIPSGEWKVNPVFHHFYPLENWEGLLWYGSSEPVSQPPYIVDRNGKAYFQQW